MKKLPTRLLLLGCSSALLSAAPLAAQTTYTAVDLTAPGSYGTAYAASAGQAAGYTSNLQSPVPGRATLWTGNGAVDLHPAFLDNPALGLIGRSTVTGFAGNLQVGWGAGSSTNNRAAAMAWNDTAASARTLTVPFANYSSQAFATDGVQIVGSALGLNRDGTSIDTYHAVVWNAATGVATDLTNGGNGSQALGVGGGQQVGYVVKTLATAALWKGTSKSLVSLHPGNAVLSQANATDGARQVGYSGYMVRVRTEAPKGNKDVRFDYATVWTGTAASALIIHPYPWNAPTVAFANSYATSVTGSFIAGYSADNTQLGTPAYYHAIVWDASFQSTDLNAFLPSGFVGSQALSVDAEGNVAGVMTSADGQRHAVLWIPNP